jgi:hypothetical protein
LAANLPKNVRADLETKAWRLSQRCWTQSRIAEELGVSQRTVSAMLDRVHRRVLAELNKQVELQKVVLTQQLFQIIDEAYQAWERSKKPKRKASKVTGRGGKPDSPDVRLEEATDRDGDNTFLGTIMQAQDRICRLWGLDVQQLDDSGRGNTVSEIVLRLKANAERFEARRQLPAPGAGS